jgi:hypothetical protein
MNPKSYFKFTIEKLLEDSLISSEYMKKIFNNITIIAVETKKMAETVMKMNDRLNQHEEIILQLANQINQTKEKNDSLSYVKSNREPSKPN